MGNFMKNLDATLGELQKDAGFELSFRIRQPQPVAPQSLLVLLHGVGSSETSLGDLAAAASPDTLVVLARGPLTLASGQFAWFRVAFTPSGPQIEAAQAEFSRLALVRFIKQLQAAYQIQPDRTVLAGFSQGGIMSASVALSEPEVVAGFGLLSGRILPELRPQTADKSRLKNLQVFVGHGDFDNTLPVAWADRSDMLLTDLEVNFESHRYPVGHTISPAMQDDFLRWLAAKI
jgi:phospholipase/carboxylesterase